MSTWIVGDSAISTSAETVPATMLATAPAVVKRRQKIESSSAGKFALAAIANASPTMNATFWPLKRDPEHDRDDAQDDGRDARDASCSFSSALPVAHDVHPEIVRQRRGARERSPATTARIVANATAAMKPRNGVPADRLGEQRRGHVAALVDRRDRVRPTSTIAPKPRTNVIR